VRNKSRSPFTTVRTEGAILPVDVLERVIDPKSKLPGMEPESYHLLTGETFNETINKAWTNLLTAWLNFKLELAKLPDGDPGTTVTRDRWLLRLFETLGYGRLPTTKSLEMGGKSYPISHGWQNTPIHLVGARVKLDELTAGVAGAARSRPHSMVQELLNRSSDHLWGIVSNGLRLRLLRDNASLTRNAYVEFDLEAMFDGGIFPDFALLWRVLHQSRVEPLEPDKPEAVWLERWSKDAKENGTRALEHLRIGVEQAINALGQGFLKHPANHGLRSKLRTGGSNPNEDGLDKQDFYRQLLRLVYRMLFLFVAEDRDSLLDPTAPESAKTLYTRYYSLSRLRGLGERRIGTKHSDLWHQLRLVCQKLGSDEGSPELGLPALGSFLFSNRAAPDLESSEIQNQALLEAVRALAFIRDAAGLRTVDYKNLRSEELGSVYESLLELHPEIHASTGEFKLETASGNERKTSGSYYTPDSLVQQLLNTALDPVLEEAARKPNPEQAILALKVVDPACGSGHFLIGAANRIAKRLATIRTGELEPGPEAIRTALRDVIGHCVYGVDINPMSVELCKVALWIEALEPGRPLSFLDHHIQCGNSLLGVTPKLLKDGIPDEAFTAIEGDDKTEVSRWRKENKLERKQQQDKLLEPFGSVMGRAVLSALTQKLEAESDKNIAGIHIKEREWEKLQLTRTYRLERLRSNAWCAAFVWRKSLGAPRPITEDTFRKLERDVQDPGVSLNPAVRDELERLSDQYQFFHWHLAFPDVFKLPAGSDAWPSGDPGQEAFFGQSKSAQPSLGEIAAPDEPENETTGWAGGFDVVLGNPPWDQIQLDPQEFFAVHAPNIAGAQHMTARNKLIKNLKTLRPELYETYIHEVSRNEGIQHFIHASKRFPLTSRGRLNLAPLFCELAGEILSLIGYSGFIVPTGIATDSFTQYFFQDITNKGILSSLYGFENEEFVFPKVHHSVKFCLLTISGLSRPSKAGANFVFFVRQTNQIQESARRFSLSISDIALLNPNTRTCPIFRSSRDAELTKSIHRRVPVLLKEDQPEKNLWDFKGMLMFMMSNGSALFHDAPQLEQDGFHIKENVYQSNFEQAFPLYEAKMIHHFDHRLGTYEGQTQAQANLGTLPPFSSAEHIQCARFPLPRYWVKEREVESRLEKRNDQGDLLWRWEKRWLLVFRDIARTTDQRTTIATILPRVAVGHTCPIAFLDADAVLTANFLANLTSFILDYCVRQKVGGTHLTFGYFKQFPILPPATYLKDCTWLVHKTLSGWILPRVLELTYTAWDLEPFAQDCGYDGTPFKWDEDRRFLMRCELDAAFFHLYEINRDDTDYILETFPIVRRKDEAAHGEYRTKRVILEIFDAMLEAQRSGLPYQTRLDPPPADPRMAHPPREVVSDSIPAD
jgi:N-6 DNA Methylase